MTAPIDMLPRLEELALEAGVAIMKIYAEDFVAEYKDDHSPVTEADTAAEKIIIAGLKMISPDIPIVAEEAFAAGYSPDISGGEFWLVDPLDGTQEFVRKNDEFTVNIALIEDGQATCGVVYAPALGKIYAGVVGEGAHSREEGSAAQEIRIRPVPDAGVTVIASRRHGDAKKIAALLDGRNVHETRNAGSSLKSPMSIV